MLRVDVQALVGPPWAFNAGDVAYIHSDETHDLSFTALRLHQKFGLDIDTIPYGCRRNVRAFEPASCNGAPRMQFCSGTPLWQRCGQCNCCAWALMTAG